MTTENAVPIIETMADALAATEDNRYEDKVEALELAVHALKSINKIKFNCYAMNKLMENFNE